MKTLKDNFIKKIGLSNPSNLKQNYFSFLESKETIRLSDDLPDIKKPVSVIVEHEILSKKTINSLQGLSSEGNYYTGKKIIIYLKLKQKILYTTENDTLHLIVNEFIDSISIVIPTTIKGSNPQKLIDYKYIESDVHIKDITLSKIDNRSIYCNIYLFATISSLPCHEITYSIYENDILKWFLCNDFGKNKKLIASYFADIYNKPKWSPQGNKIAFIFYDENIEAYTLNIYDLSTNEIKNITKLKKFNKISSFCWSQDGSSIIFSGINYKNNELFNINLSNFNIQQLTFGKSNVRSSLPLVSPNNKYIGFLQSIHKTSNLFLMDPDGKNIKKLTSAKTIKCFDWSNDSNNILYVSNNRDEKDTLYILDINSLQKRKYDLPNDINKIRKAKYSPNNKFFTFVGSNYFTDNLYLYNFNDNSCINLTKNFDFVHICDLDWEVGSSSIFYSCNYYNYYNIYCISLENFKITNVTNTTSSNIFLNYRPKII